MHEKIAESVLMNSDAVSPVRDEVFTGNRTRRGRSGGKVLCVVAAGLSDFTGTFVRAHVDGIAPGRTVVITFDDSEAANLGVPAINLSFPVLNGGGKLQRKLRSIWNTFRRGNAAPLEEEQIAELIQFLKTHEVDVVLAEYGPTACIVREACQRLGIPLFAHFHGYDISRQLVHWRARVEYRRMARYASGLICPSRFTADRLIQIGIPESLVSVSPYGVDVDRFKPTERVKENYIVAVGRFVEKKAPHHTIRAFAQVARNHPGLSMEMIGEGPLLADCRELATQLGLGGRIVFHGAMGPEVIVSRMTGACLFVQHSVTAADGNTEGLPVAILEAMGCGLPVVATRHSGIPEAVIEGETGFLVDEHDVEGMAVAIGKLIEDKGLSREMGESGRNRAVEHFSTGVQMERLRALMGV